MSRVFTSDINTNLHPDFFEYKNVTQPEHRTRESVEKGEPVWSKIDQDFKDIPMFDETSKDNYACKALSNIQEVTPFSRLFFSQKNIKEIQRLIRYNVYVNSDKKHVIGNQDETELVIIMRGQYLQYARVRSDPEEYKKEIKRLNGLVVTYLLPDIISNIEQYVGYIKDSTSTYIPIDRGSNPSIKGQKTLRSVSDVLVGDDNFFGSIV